MWKYIHQKRTAAAALLAAFTMAACTAAAVALLPLSSVSAQTEKPVMSFGSDYIAANELVYFGMYEDGTPDQYQVLNNDGELYSVKILDKIYYRDPSDGLKNIWADSNAENWCENVYYKNAFNAIEKPVILSVSKNDGAYKSTGDWYEPTKYIAHELTDVHAYFLSAEEIENYFPTADDRIAFMADSSEPNYWTRSRAWGTGVMVGNIAQKCDTFESWMSIEPYTRALINIGSATRSEHVPPSRWIKPESIS